jgi:hypothetical protein
MRTIRTLALTCLLGFAAPGIPGAQARDAAPNVVQSIDYAFFAGGKLAVKIVFKDALTAPPETFTTFYPAVRVVLDFPNMRSAVGAEPMRIRQRDLWTLQVVRSGPRARVIIQLLQPMIKDMETTGNELLITLHRP